MSIKNRDDGTCGSLQQRDSGHCSVENSAGGHPFVTSTALENWAGFFWLTVVEGIANHFWFLRNQIMMLPWKLPSVVQADRAIAFA